MSKETPPTPTLTDFHCSLCDGLMTSIPGSGGFYLKCFNTCDPLCHENVEGHGRTEKEAHSVACQKYQRP